jgi:hypothetical protein
LFTAQYFALMAGLLFFKTLVHDFALTAGVQHSLKGDVDAALGDAEVGGAFVAAFFESALVVVGVGGVCGGALFSEQGAKFLPRGVQVALGGGEVVEGLAAKEQRLRVLFHGLLLLALAHCPDGFECEVK